MSLRALGWCPFFEEAFAPFSKDGLTAARVAVQHRGGYEVWTASEVLPAEVSGRFRHQAPHASDYPAVGDWVEVDLTPLQRFALSTAPLPEHLIWVTKPDWVTSAAKNETFVMRSGPLRCLNRGWKKPDELSQHRRVYQKDLYEIWTGFRVVAPVGIDAKPDSLAPKTIRKTVKRAKVSRSL